MPDDWHDDELVSLSEAAALYFPFGPLNAAALRVAHRRGELGCVEVCGRTFTTPRAVKAMMALSRERSSADRSMAPTTSLAPDASIVVEELRRRLRS